MGLFRCPKCDSICRTEEEVCHICGYRFKPEQPKVEEPKVEEKPQEEKKEESKLDQKFTIGSGFSRKSVFNSVSFDKKEEPKKETVVNENPFAGLDTKKEEPKEDIFEAFEKQTSDANSIFNEKPIEPKVVKVEPIETKPIDVEPIIKPVEEPKVEEPKVEMPKVETPKVEEVKAEAPIKETKEEIKETIKPEKEEKIAKEPKVEEKPKVTSSNPYVNTGYKQNYSTTTPSEKSSTNVSTFPTGYTQAPKKGEPVWVRAWRESLKKNRKTATIWAIVLFTLFIIFLIIAATDQKEVFHSYSTSYYGSPDGYWDTEAKGGWVFMCVITGIGFLVALIMAVVSSTGTLYVKEIEGYYVLVYGHSNNFKLILENHVVDKFYGSNYGGMNTTIKLSGVLPNKKVVIASIFYKNYNRVIKVELFENNNNDNKK